MALRRKAAAPQTTIDVLNERIERLEKQIKSLRQAGPTTIQAGDTSVYAEPIPWEAVINHPGVHTDATAADPFVYYHPGDTDIGGTTVAGFKKVGGSVHPWTRRRRRTSQSIISGSIDAIEFDYDTNDYPDFFDHVVQSGQGPAIKVLQDGWYSFLARVVVNTLSTEFIIDLNFYPDGLPDIFSYTFPVSQMCLSYRVEGAAHMNIRLKANQTCVMFIAHEAGSPQTIGDGTFLECQYLGPTSVTGLDWPLPLP